MEDEVNITIIATGFESEKNKAENIQAALHAQEEQIKKVSISEKIIEEQQLQSAPQEPAAPEKDSSQPEQPASSPEQPSPETNIEQPKQEPATENMPPKEEGPSNVIMKNQEETNYEPVDINDLDVPTFLRKEHQDNSNL